MLAGVLSRISKVDACAAFRQHPHWQWIGFPPDSRTFHDAFWPRLRPRGFARRRSFDGRLALTFLQAGVTQFATADVKDFEGFGVERVWCPIARWSECAVSPKFAGT